MTGRQWTGDSETRHLYNHTSADWRTRSGPQDGNSGSNWGAVVALRSNYTERRSPGTRQKKSLEDMDLFDARIDSMARILENKIALYSRPILLSRIRAQKSCCLGVIHILCHANFTNFQDTPSTHPCNVFCHCFILFRHAPPDTRA